MFFVLYTYSSMIIYLNPIYDPQFFIYRYTCKLYNSIRGTYIQDIAYYPFLPILLHFSYIQLFFICKVFYHSVVYDYWIKMIYYSVPMISSHSQMIEITYNALRISLLDEASF